MHGRAESLRYWYSNPEFSSRAVDHAFKYISAVTGVRFIRDRSGPQIWRSDDEPVPDSVVTDLGQADETKPLEESYSAAGDVSRRPISEGDPVEEIIKRLSLKARIGPLAGENPPGKVGHIPLLSQLIVSLIDRLSVRGLIELKSQGIALWPEGNRFAVAVTHDVDMARRSVMGSIRLLWHKEPPGRLRGLVDSIISVFGGRNPYDKIPEWLIMERSLGIKSTFFVFAGNRTHRHDPKYRLSDFSDSMDQILKNGSELALHSGVACYSGENLPAVRSTLEDYVKNRIAGLRPHYLSAHLPEYWRAASAAGFAYTSCLGFDDDVGYFKGIDLPFVPFDVETDSAIDIVEIPLAVMDCGLIRDDPADSEDVFERGRNMIHAVESVGGLMVLDWHQRTLYDPDYPGWGGLFSKVVKYALERGAFFTTTIEISSLLKDRMGDQG